MFENLSDRLSKTLRNISGRGRLTEDNIKETLPVVRYFINNLKERAMGV